MNKRLTFKEKTPIVNVLIKRPEFIMYIFKYNITKLLKKLKVAKLIS